VFALEPFGRLDASGADIDYDHLCSRPAQRNPSKPRQTLGQDGRPVFDKRFVAERYPDLNGPDYATIIDQPVFDRLVATLEDAKARGATGINLAPDQQPDARRRKLARDIVLGVDDEMTIMKEEIFGPLLTIKPYREVDEVIAYVNRHDRPLAFYSFTNDKRLASLPSSPSRRS
jgi:acyl-CoA reductase-like NAD-dependent aldehyde dehydrogenase